MPRKAKQQEGLKLPTIVPGSWRGEILGGGSLHFGQAVQPGPPRQSVEFSYIILSVALIMPETKFTWPGIVMIMAPTPMKTESSDAGLLVKSHAIPALSLALDVTRPQFSDMVMQIQARRLKNFRFTVEQGANDTWPIHSWGTSIELGDKEPGDG